LSYYFAMLLIYTLSAVKKYPEKFETLLSGLNGISGASLYVVKCKEISAVVSDIKKADLIASRSIVLEYAEVIDNLAKLFTLLPMRFGSVMESIDAIADMLERNYCEIQLNLLKVEDKLEFGLKVFCDSEKLKEELLTKTKDGIKSPANPAHEIENSVFREYVNKKLKEHRLEELVLVYVDSVIAEINSYLSFLNADSKIKKLPSASVMIDAVLLLPKGRKNDLIQAAGDLQNQYPGLSFVMTGPWPPYSFVEIAIK